MKLTPNRVGVLLLLLLIAVFAVWSKLRFVDDKAQEPQRWRIEDFERLRNENR
jgi:hypothetical protein